MSSISTYNEVFVYTGPRGAAASRDVVRVRVDPSVTSIPTNALRERKKLTEVELCEGLVEIGDHSFMWCYHSITKIVIPNSLRRIKDYAFQFSLRCPIRLNDGIESIGTAAFALCIFTNLRVPPLITVIPEYMLMWCKSMFSLELSENVTEIENGALTSCFCLRNVAFPPDAVFGDDIFFDEEEMDIHTFPPDAAFGDDIFFDEDYDEMTDLQRLFGSNARIIWELQHRFDGLTIHSIVYYQSYYQGVQQNLIAAINMRSGQGRMSMLDPTGNQQDCLGMTPLHILTCSSAHDLEVYRLIVEKYPANLITEDSWGALPLLYAFWGAAPIEIIQFLLERYQLLYPDHIFNWTMMVDTMGRCDTPKERIENLLHVKQMHFPEQPIDWDYLLDKFANATSFSFSRPFQERVQYIVMCGMSTRVESLAFKVWRDCIFDMIHTANFEWDKDNHPILYEIREKLAHFEAEYPKLEEATTILELALWKMKIYDNSLGENTTRHQKKIKTEESDIRSQCRLTCGADVVIGHVLPFLITA